MVAAAAARAAVVVFILASSISAAGLGLNPSQNVPVLSSLVAKDERKRQARRSTKFPSPTTSIQSHCFISADKGLTEILEDLWGFKDLIYLEPLILSKQWFFLGFFLRSVHDLNISISIISLIWSFIFGVSKLVRIYAKINRKLLYVVNLSENYFHFKDISLGEWIFQW